MSLATDNRFGLLGVKHLGWHLTLKRGYGLGVKFFGGCLQWIDLNDVIYHVRLGNVLIWNDF